MLPSALLTADIVGETQRQHACAVTRHSYLRAGGGTRTPNLGHGEPGALR